MEKPDPPKHRGHLDTAGPDDPLNESAQPVAAETVRSAAPDAAASSTHPPATEPDVSAQLRTLGELMDRERVQILTIQAMMKCLNDVLLYSDDDNAVMHADVAIVAARLLDESAARVEVLVSVCSRCQVEVQARFRNAQLSPNSENRTVVPR